MSVVMLTESKALEDKLIVYTWSVSNSSHSISPVTFTPFPNDAASLQVIKEVFKKLLLIVLAERVDDSNWDMFAELAFIEEKFASAGNNADMVFPIIEMFVPAIKVSWYPLILEALMNEKLPVVISARLADKLFANKWLVALMFSLIFNS